MDSEKAHECSILERVRTAYRDIYANAAPAPRSPAVLSGAKRTNFAKPPSEVAQSGGGEHTHNGPHITKNLRAALSRKKRGMDDSGWPRDAP